MEYRKLGNRPATQDLELSVLGFGGIVVADRPQDEANDEVARAIDQGITYFDVAPQYQNAQQILGPALEPYRQNVTLACKTLERSGDKARADLEDSLRKLRTDHFDIYQLHAMTTEDDYEQALAPGGALEAIIQARDEGKVRLIGFSAHNQEIALKLINTDQFDTMLVPLNYVLMNQSEDPTRNFGPAMLDAANAKGMGILALKAMARAKILEGEDRSYGRCWYHPEDRPDIAHLLLRYTLNLPGVTAAIPPGDPSLFQLALNCAKQPFNPLSPDDEQLLASSLAQSHPIFTT